MYNKEQNNSENSNLEKDLKIAAHDLNNLLNNVINGIELLKDKISKDDSIDKLIKNIEQNAILSSEIIQQFSTPNSIYRREKSAIDLKQIIFDTIELLGKDFDNLIHLDGIKESHIIWGNYSDIKRVLRIS